MADKSDLYLEWLGIRRGSRPLTNYELLGLPSFESQSEAIEQHAEQQLQKLAQFLKGEHALQAKRLAFEIQSARTCLLNPATKASYDAGLRSRVTSGTPCATEAKKASVPPPFPENSLPPPPPSLQSSNPSDKAPSQKPEPKPDQSDVPSDDVYGLAPTSEPAKQLEPLRPVQRLRSADRMPKKPLQLKRRSDILWKVLVAVGGVAGAVLLVMGANWMWKTAIPLNERPVARKPSPPKEVDGEAATPIAGKTPLVQPPKPIDNGSTATDKAGMQPRAGGSSGLRKAVGAATVDSEPSSMLADRRPVRATASKPIASRPNMAEETGLPPGTTRNGLGSPDGQLRIASTTVPNDGHVKGNSKPRGGVYVNLVLPSGATLTEAKLALPQSWKTKLFPEKATVYVDKYVHGAVRGIYSLDNAKIHGAAATLYENGRLQLLGFYSKANLDGPLKYWSENGERLLYAEYKNGKKHGVVCLFRHNTPWLLQELEWGDLLGEYVVRYAKGALNPIPVAEMGTDDRAECSEAKEELTALEQKMKQDETQMKQELAEKYRKEDQRIKQERFAKQASARRESQSQRLNAHNAQKSAAGQSLWRQALNGSGF